jgi:hypothetical protein
VGARKSKWTEPKAGKISRIVGEDFLWGNYKNTV